MGSQITYCNSCGEQVSADDLAAGRAAKYELKDWCATCLDQLLNRVPPEERRQILLSIRRSVKASEHGEIKAPAPVTPVVKINMPKPPTIRIDSAVASMKQIEPRPPQRRSPAAIIAVLVLVLVAGGGAYVWLKRGETSKPVEPSRAMNHDRAAEPAAAKPIPKDKDAAVARYEAARLYALAHPEDLDRIVRMYADASEAAVGTAFGEEIEREMAVLRDRLGNKVREETVRFRSVADPLLNEQRFALVKTLCDSQRGLYMDKGWRDFVDGYLAEVERRAGRELDAIEIEARALSNAGKKIEAERMLKKAEEFGLAGISDRVAKIRESLTGEPPSATPPVVKRTEDPKPTKPEIKPPVEPTRRPDPTPTEEPAKPAVKDAAAQRRLFEQAWSHAVKVARGREYDRAVQTLEFAGRSIEEAEIKAELDKDVEMLKLAGTVVKGAVDELMKLKKDSYVSLKYLDDELKPKTARGKVSSVTSDGINLASGDEVQLVPFSSVAASELVEYFSKRPDAGADDARSVGAFALFDGDLKRARKELGGEFAGLPEKYRSLGSDDPGGGGGGPGPDPAPVKNKEEAAKELFEQAEKDFLANKIKEAIDGYQELKKRHRSTDVWRENRKTVEERLKTGFETVILAGTMKATTYWQRQTFPGAPIQDAYTFPYSFVTTRPTYYMDMDFFAQGDTVYRIWVLVGGDGKENTAFQVQFSGAVAKDGKSAEVGQASFVDVPPLPSVATKTSTGLTNAWGWTSVAYQKFKDSGTQKFRIYASKRGHSIAAVVISAEKYRANAPNPKDLGQ